MFDAENSSQKMLDKSKGFCLDKASARSNDGAFYCPWLRRCQMKEIHKILQKKEGEE